MTYRGHRVVSFIALILSVASTSAGVDTPTATPTVTPTNTSTFVSTSTPTRTNTPMPAPGTVFAYIGTFDNTVSVIDTGADTVVATVPVGQDPWGVAVGPNGSFVYTADTATGTVSFVDTSTNTVVNTASVGVAPFGLAIDPSGSRLYVGNNTSSTVSVVSTATAAVTSTIPITGGAFGVAAHPAGFKVYVANPAADQVSVIGTFTNTVIDTIALGDDPRGIAINPAGTRVYVANLGSNTVSVVDPATDAVVDTVAVGSGPDGIAVSPNGTRVYVTNYFDDTVSAIDATTNTVIATIPVGDSPLGVCVHPVEPKAYVANGGAGTVSVIDTDSNTELYQVSVGTGPVAFGQFISGPSPAAVSAIAGTGTLTVTLTPSTLTGTLYFDPGPFSVFGTPVDVAAAVGYAPMDVSAVTTPLPGGFGLSFNATNTYTPSFSLSGTGTVVLTGQVLFGFPTASVTVLLGTSSGGVLPTSPFYTLTADLSSTGWLSFQGPFRLGATLPANTPAGTDVTVYVTSTVGPFTTLQTPVTVTFAAVTTSGVTLVTGTSRRPGTVPANVGLDLGAGVGTFYFDVSTTATYIPPITICVGYPDLNDDGRVDGVLVDETKLVLLHDELGAGNFQQPVNQYVDAALNRVCAEVDGLSPFLLGVNPIPKGFIPPDSDARKCENKLLKEAAKLVKAAIKCNRKAAEAALKGNTFDASGCESEAGTKYDQKVAGLTPCPPCVGTNDGGVGDAAVSSVETSNAALYCAGSTPLGGNDVGFVPPDAAAAGCAKKEGKSIAKLTKQLAKCYRKNADAAFKGDAFDLDACLSEAGARFDADIVALSGCPACVATNAPSARNQSERFVAEVLEDVYCAGTAAIP